MPDIGTETLLILALLALNGLLAMSEIAIVTARKIRLQRLAEDGDRRAAVALELGSDPSRFLSTVQIGITAVGILAGAFGGATLTRELQTFFGTVPVLAPYREPLSFSLVVVVITYLSLVIGELVPKQVALADPERIAVYVAKPMHVLSRLAAPIVWLLTISTEAILTLLRVRRVSDDVVSDDEIKLLIQQATRSGAFQAVEQELMEGALDLGEQRVYELMTARPRVVWLDVEDPPEENWRKVSASSHTSFPVCEGGLDSVLGIVSIKQLWERLINGQSVDLRTIDLKPPIYVLDRQPALKLFEVFQEPGVGLALVIEERGNVEGVVSLADLIEAIVGDAALLGKRRDHQPIQREDGSWLLDGLMAIDDLKEILELDDIPGEDQGRYQSLGGFIFALAGKVPETGDYVEWDGWRLEVVDMDGRRIDKVLGMPLHAKRESFAEAG